MIGWLSGEQSAEMFKEGLCVDNNLGGFRGVIFAFLCACVSLCSFISSSEPSEPLSRLFSDSAGDSRNREERENTKLHANWHSSHNQTIQSTFNFSKKPHLTTSACSNIEPVLLFYFIILLN